MSSWTLAAALVALRGEVDGAHPDRSKASDGTIGDAAHASRTSDHNPDAAGVVRAWDCTAWVDPATGVDVAEQLAEYLRAARDPRVRYVIWRRRIFSSTISAWTWRPYDGTNPHEHHCHISVQPHPRGDDPSPWHYGDSMALLDDILAQTRANGAQLSKLAAAQAEFDRKETIRTAWNQAALDRIEAKADQLIARPAGLGITP